MKSKAPNHPVIVWGACILWVLSLFMITWSFALFFCIGDMLSMLGIDLVTAAVLLSGLIMLPTNVHLLYMISQGHLIHHKAKVVCCPLWLSMGWVIFINTVGAILCALKLHSCWAIIKRALCKGLKHYRSAPKYKRLMDNLQWTLKCCGLHSYKDWFTRDWYDKIRDYEWDPTANKLQQNSPPITDSVPLSCCKSGSCISNYLMEMGTHSINTRGCDIHVFRLVMLALVGHLILFLTVIFFEVLLLRYMFKQCKDLEKCKGQCGRYMVTNIMSAKQNFDASSGSLQADSDHSDDSQDTDSVKEGDDH